MKFNIDFDVIAVCKHYKNGNDEIIEDNINLKLKIDKVTASNFLFRFSPPMFRCDKYNIVLKFNDIGTLKGIAIIDNDNIFIVNNFDEFLADIAEGYIRIRTTEKLHSIMEFDFETALEDADGIVDEFDIKDK